MVLFDSDNFHHELIDGKLWFVLKDRDQASLILFSPAFLKAIAIKIELSLLLVIDKVVAIF